MELKAKHILVGSFVLIGVFSLFAFAAWLAKVEFDQETTFYEIFFENSVSGLSPAGDVRYRGINVGSAQRIDIDPENPERVRVLVKIDAAVPVREGDTARLEFQGITGVSYINIEGSRPGAAVLTARKGERYPVIPSGPSQFEKLARGAPDLIASGKALTDRAADLLNAENRRIAAGILADIARVTASIASRTGEIENIIDSLDRSRADFSEAARSIRGAANKAEALIADIELSLSAARGTLAGVDKLVGGEGEAAVVEFRQTMRALNELARELNATVAENREPLRRFSGEGLGEFRRFLAETRQLVAKMTRITERIENDPTRFLFGPKEPEFKAK